MSLDARGDCASARGGWPSSGIAPQPLRIAAIGAGAAAVALHLRLMGIALEDRHATGAGRSFTLIRIGWACLAASLAAALGVALDAPFDGMAALFGIAADRRLAADLPCSASCSGSCRFWRRCIRARAGGCAPTPSSLTAQRPLAIHFACHLAALALARTGSDRRRQRAIRRPPGRWSVARRGGVRRAFLDRAEADVRPRRQGRVAASRIRRLIGIKGTLAAFAYCGTGMTRLGNGMNFQRQVSRALDEEHRANLDLLGRVEQAFARAPPSGGDARSRTRHGSPRRSRGTSSTTSGATSTSRSASSFRGSRRPGRATSRACSSEEHGAIREVAAELLPLARAAAAGRSTLPAGTALKRGALETGRAAGRAHPEGNDGAAADARRPARRGDRPRARVRLRGGLSGRRWQLEGTDDGSRCVATHRDPAAAARRPRRGGRDRRRHRGADAPRLLRAAARGRAARAEAARAVRGHRRQGPRRVHSRARAGRRVRPPRARAAARGDRRARRRQGPWCRRLPVRRACATTAAGTASPTCARTAAWNDHRMLRWIDAMGFTLAPNHVRRLRGGRRRVHAANATIAWRCPAARAPAHEIDYGGRPGNDFERLARDMRRRPRDGTRRPRRHRAHRPQHHRARPPGLHAAQAGRGDARLGDSRFADRAARRHDRRIPDGARRTSAISAAPSPWPSSTPSASIPDIAHRGVGPRAAVAALRQSRRAAHRARRDGRRAARPRVCSASSTTSDSRRRSACRSCGGSD